MHLCRVSFDYSSIVIDSISWKNRIPERAISGSAKE